MTQTNQVQIKLNLQESQRENMWMASSSLQSFTVLTDEDGVPGSIFERESEEYTVEQLKRWLRCRGFKLSGKRDELVKRVRDCVNSGNHQTLDPSVDNGKMVWPSKILKERSGCTRKMQCKFCSVYSIEPLACFSIRTTFLPSLTMATCTTTRWNRFKILMTLKKSKTD